MSKPTTFWFPVGGTIQAGDEEPKPCWTATCVPAEEPAFHPIFDTQMEAMNLCGALNILAWSETDFFDHSREAVAAHNEGKLAALIVKRTVRGFWRGFTSALIGKDKR